MKGKADIQSSGLIPKFIYTTVMLFTTDVCEHFGIPQTLLTFILNKVTVWMCRNSITFAHFWTNLIHNHPTKWQQKPQQ